MCSLLAKHLWFVIACRCTAVMDPSVLERLHANLSLDDTALPMLEVNDEVLAKELASLENCLVEKVLYTRIVNREDFYSALLCLWGKKSNFVIESPGLNKFVFSFANSKEKQRILANGPWHFNRSLIFLEEPCKRDLGELNFNQVDFWVQVHDMPLV